MKTLVTGGHGFIGGQLIKALKKRNHEVTSYDLIDGNDVLDKENLEKFIKDCDVVFDCSGVLGSAETINYIEKTIDVNMKGTVNILKCALAHNKKVVYMSLKNEWHNPYMIAKRGATEFCQMYHQYFGLDVSVVRGLNAYGAGQHWGSVRKVVPTFIVQAINNEPLCIYGSGKQIADFIHVEDMVEIMIRIWEKNVWGKVIDAGTGVPTTINELVATIIRLAGSSSKIDYLPMRKGEPDNAIALANPADALQLLDFYPKIRLEEGMKETVEWYKIHWNEMKY